ncbi:MAG TPA: hypothetical protein VHJ37_04920 [Thermoleophilaceae bacterium]|jgi:hypothetical protein|nr:hypothetical protein [Thermoleophilaceae bacterium]
MAPRSAALELVAVVSAESDSLSSLPQPAAASVRPAVARRTAKRVRAIKISCSGSGLGGPY